jgi:hypothetical protein
MNTLSLEEVLAMPMDERCNIPPAVLHGLGLRVIDGANGLPQWAGTEEEFVRRIASFCRRSNSNGNGG